MAYTGGGARPGPSDWGLADKNIERDSQKFAPGSIHSFSELSREESHVFPFDFPCTCKSRISLDLRRRKLTRLRLPYRLGRYGNALKNRQRSNRRMSPIPRRIAVGHPQYPFPKRVESVQNPRTSSHSTGLELRRVESSFVSARFLCYD